MLQGLINMWSWICLISQRAHKPRNKTHRKHAISPWASYLYGEEKQDQDHRNDNMLEKTESSTRLNSHLTPYDPNFNHVVEPSMPSHHKPDLIEMSSARILIRNQKLKKKECAGDTSVDCLIGDSEDIPAIHVESKENTGQIVTNECSNEEHSRNTLSHNEQARVTATEPTIETDTVKITDALADFEYLDNILSNIEESVKDFRINIS